MKNIISVLLAVVLSFSVVGCSSSKTTTSNNKTTQTTKTNTVKSGNTSKNSGEDLYERLFVDDDKDYDDKDYDDEKKEENYIGNKNTKKFHKSDCSYLPKEKNRVYFSKREDATEQYYKPCKNCNP